jgi:hypothetical protein
MKVQQKDNPKFSFLLTTNNNFRYYRHKLKTFVGLKEQNKLLPDAPPVAKSTNNNAIIETLESSTTATVTATATTNSTSIVISTGATSSTSLATSADNLRSSASGATLNPASTTANAGEQQMPREAYDAALVVAQRLTTSSVVSSSMLVTPDNINEPDLTLKLVRVCFRVSVAGRSLFATQI